MNSHVLEHRFDSSQLSVRFKICLKVLKRSALDTLHGTWNELYVNTIIIERTDSYLLFVQLKLFRKVII